MAKQVINLGTPPSGSDGDTQRTANVKVNANFDELYTRAQGKLTKSIAGGAGTVALSAAEALNGIIDLTGVITGNKVVTVPATPTMPWLVRNSTSGSFTVTFKTAAGTGVEIPRGMTQVLASDGTNVVGVGNQGRTLIATITASGGPATVFNNLPVFDVYELVFDGLVPNTTADMAIHLSNDNGASWFIAQYENAQQFVDTQPSATNGSRVNSDNMFLWGLASNVANGQPYWAAYSGRVQFHNFRNVNKLPQALFDMVGISSVTGRLGRVSGCSRLVALTGLPINAFRIFAGASGFASGKMMLYGYNS